ncbi:MAG: HTH domain-containing protein [Peptococcaceae bacterium]|nr:HTH domain-containing protein [Peptococcaceae bacterium]
MEGLLENLLHVPVQEKVFDPAEKLPLLFTGLYDIRAFVIGERLVYLIRPKEPLSLTKLKKHFAKLAALLDGDCILYDDGYTRYGISKLVEMGIPFIFGDQNIYLPNLGIQIHEKPRTKLPDVEQFSPFTQKLVLTALYQRWQHISGKEMAEYFGVSRMTVNRALLELEALDLPLVAMEGKTKYLKYAFSRGMLYDLCKDYLINPVKKSIRLRVKPENVSIKSGVSALAAYTLLGDDPYQTFAVTQEQYRQLALNHAELAEKDEVPACIVQIHRYLIENNNIVDPLSAILSLPKDALEDVRIEQAVEEIKEAVFGGRWPGKI